MLADLGFERVAVLDLRRLGGSDGYDVELAEKAISSTWRSCSGRGPRNAPAELREKRAKGGLLDPYTPVLRDLIATQAAPAEDEPLPTPVKRESPRGFGIDAEGNTLI